MLDAPQYLYALLLGLEEELDRVMWNLTQEDYESPFRNTGNRFKCPVFEVRAYYWGDDDEEYDKPNFRYKDIEFKWYKHMGRDLRINREITPQEAIEMYNDCLYAIQSLEYGNADGTDKLIWGKPSMRYIKGYESES